MGMAGSLILIANPGSASRKYALFEGEQERARLHFEWEGDKVLCALHQSGERRVLSTDVRSVDEATAQIAALLHGNGLLKKSEQIEKIGLRIVAPSAYFLEDRLVDKEMLARLEAAEARAPIHITATLKELHALRSQFGNATIVGVSDSAFHATKPDYAWNYGIPLHDADRLDIKRFGYHGLSVAAAVRTLEKAGKLPPKLIVCHLGSGASVTAVHGGKSLDTTMGYSPLEGLIMATRSGSIDPTAVYALGRALDLDEAGMEAYLNTQSGLLGLGGSSDLRELLEREAAGDHHAHLAIQTYVFAVQKAVGQMAAALGGVDALVFTGTVGERSAPIRQRISQRLHYLDFIVDEKSNAAASADAQELTLISRIAHSKPVYVVPADEAAEMVRHVLGA